MSVPMLQADDLAAIARNPEGVISAMLTQPQASCPVIHRFGPGVYIREVRLPAGTLAVGHHQNFEHMNVMLQGRVTVLRDDGGTAELVAPMIYVGQPGRKIGYIHEDTVWLNIYSTDETDVEKLEAHFLTKTEQWTEHLAAVTARLLPHTKKDQDDYQAVLTEFGVTEAQARAESEDASTLRSLPFGGYKIKVGDSSIEGKGLFATADIAAGEIIAPARIGDTRTLAGRYTNHSAEPNAEFVRQGAIINLVALRPIAGCHGGHDGEEITVNYRQALQLAIAIREEQ